MKIHRKKNLPLWFLISVVHLLPLTAHAISYTEPWGKDSDLIIKPKIHKPTTSSPFVWAAEKAIWFHQNIISPVDGPRSHFRPSSSQYMLEAMRQNGFIEGFFLGCDRLLRENDSPWVYRTIEVDGKLIKWDPPPKGKR